MSFVDGSKRSMIDPDTRLLACSMLDHRSFGFRDERSTLQSSLLQSEVEEEPRKGVSRRQWWTLVAIHFTVGVTNTMQGVALKVYQIDTLRASPSIQDLIGGVLMSAPWNLKIFFAFLSDCVPICGQRRKPYFFAGVIVQALGWLALGILPESVGLLGALGFVVTLGQVVVGTMCDALYVENMKYEQEGKQGVLQMNCWMALSVGSLAGTLLGGASLDFWGVKDKEMFTITGSLKLLLVPLIALLSDPRVESSPTNPDDETSSSKVSQQFHAVYKAMKESRVWQPVLFIFIYSAWPGNGSAFQSFLRAPEEDGGLGFSYIELGYVLAVAGAGGTIGTFIYQQCLMNAPWRPLFVGVIFVADSLSCLSLILIFRLNARVGIPNVAFALGDDVVNNVAQQFVGMPMLILMARICPVGVESSVFALVTSLQMVGQTVSGSLSSEVTNAFGVTLTNFDNLWKLTLFTALINLASLLFIPLVPKSTTKAVLDKSRSSLGAILLGSLLVGGLSYSLTNAIITLAIGQQSSATIWSPLVLPILLAVLVTVSVVRYERRASAVAHDHEHERDGASKNAAAEEGGGSSTYDRDTYDDSSSPPRGFRGSFRGSFSQQSEGARSDWSASQQSQHSRSFNDSAGIN